MATYLPVRAFNRSQAVRIGGQKVRSVIKAGDADATSSNVGSLAPVTYIDLENTTARKELGYHSAIGAVYTCGRVTPSNYNYVTVSGLTVTQSSSAGSKLDQQAIANGVVRNRNNGSVVSITGTTLTTTLAASGKTRIDTLVYDTTDSTLKQLNGTETTGTPVAPTVNVATQVPIYTFTVSNTATSSPSDIRVLEANV